MHFGVIFFAWGGFKTAVQVNKVRTAFCNCGCEVIRVEATGEDELLVRVTRAPLAKAVPVAGFAAATMSAAFLESIDQKDVGKVEQLLWKGCVGGDARGKPEVFAPDDTRPCGHGGQIYVCLAVNLEFVEAKVRIHLKALDRRVDVYKYPLADVNRQAGFAGIFNGDAAGRALMADHAAVICALFKCAGGVFSAGEATDFNSDGRSCRLRFWHGDCVEKQIGKRMRFLADGY